MNLTNDIMLDGSRNFLLLPVGKVAPLRLLFRIFTLPGAYPTAYIPSLDESWIDFKYQGQKFSINNQFGDYWFFVKNAKCPENILQIVSSHFEVLLCDSP